MNEISNNNAEHGNELDTGYTTSVLIQAFLPYKNPNARELITTRGARTLTLYSPEGLPYGRYARLIVAYLTTEAFKRSRDGSIADADEARTIPLGNTFNDFLRNIGAPEKGRWFDGRTIKLVREQLKRLGGLSIHVRKRWDNDAERLTLAHFKLTDAIDWSSNPNQGQLFEPRIIIDRAFFEEIAAHGVPFSLAIMRELKSAPAIDAYLWATYNVFTQSEYGGARLSWEQAHEMFGANYADDKDGRKNFKRRFRQTLDNVREAWPEFVWSENDEGIFLPPQKPSVPPTIPHREQLRREISGE